MIQDTVAAVSTPKGKGGVSMIRISGADTQNIVNRVFSSKGKKGGNLKETPRKAIYGSFYDADGVFDDGIVTFFASPASYTGEDTAELCCHGGILVTQRLLQAVFTAGAVPAGPGEFTKRAFINGKLSLTQAEAIGSVIDATTNTALEIGIRQARGSLSKKIDALYRELCSLAAAMYAYTDYPDEDLADVSDAEMREKLLSVKNRADRLVRSHKYGRAVSEGVKTAIVGKTNTGKSSLLNMLLGFDRAIVSDIAGTTRDTVSAQCSAGGVLLLLSDTAGIRDNAGEIEALGIQRSLEELEKAQLVLAVFDLSRGLDGGDIALAEKIKAAGKEKCTLAVFNKNDIAKDGIKDEYKKLFERSVCVSAKTGQGREELENQIAEICGAGDTDEDGEAVLGARQAAALARASEQLESALCALDDCARDAACTELEGAMAALGEVDGRAVTEDIVSEIFSHFCVGK